MSPAPAPAGPLPKLGDLWMLQAGPEQDVVVSSRIRLARNLQGYRFRSRLRPEEGGRLEQVLREAVLTAAPDLRYVAVHELDAGLREVLFERHMISAEQMADGPPRGVAFTPDATTSVMVNEEDHLRLQVFAPGLELEAIDRRVNELDDRLSALVPFAFQDRWGYLTSCPTNTGTGLRVSVMLHLPALSFRTERRDGRGGEQGILKVHKAAQQLGLTVRGAHGESSRAEGDFYQISNQVTLGKSPGEVISDLRSTLERIIEYERNSRAILMKDEPARLEDVIWRGWGILCNARRISSKEALAHLAALRLGCCLGIVDKVRMPTLHALMIAMRPGHLQLAAGRELPPRERDAVRAKLIRDSLCAG